MAIILATSANSRIPPAVPNISCPKPTGSVLIQDYPDFWRIIYWRIWRG